MTEPNAWLLDLADERRTRIRKCEFFDWLRSVNRKEDLAPYLYQLAHFSPWFISALSIRAGSCTDERFADVFREHAHEEGLHPEQFRRWRFAHGLTCDAPPTRETVELAAVCMWSATREPPDDQVLRLNLAAEGVALDVFQASIAVLDDLGISSGPGPFWRVHGQVDGEHLKMGLDRIPEQSPRDSLGIRQAEIVDHTLDMFERMLLSWVPSGWGPLG